MILHSDAAYATTAIILSVAIIAGAWVARARVRSDEAAKKELEGNAKVAYDTLVSFGYSKDEAESRVRKAVGKLPSADYKTLISVALKFT